MRHLAASHVWYKTHTAKPCCGHLTFLCYFPHEKRYPNTRGVCVCCKQTWKTGFFFDNPGSLQRRSAGERQSGKLQLFAEIGREQCLINSWFCKVQKIPPELLRFFHFHGVVRTESAQNMAKRAWYDLGQQLMFPEIYKGLNSCPK